MDQHSLAAAASAEAFLALGSPDTRPRPCSTPPRGEGSLRRPVQDVADRQRVPLRAARSPRPNRSLHRNPVVSSRSVALAYAYDPATAPNAEPDNAFVHSNGGFRCLQDVRQGPLQGCLQGEGVRWDTDGLLQSTGFKCTGRASEPTKTAVTDAHTAVLESDFYRAGDGNDASFKNVQVIIADHDLAPDIDGIQNVWIQQVGCGTADVNFSS